MRIRYFFVLLTLVASTYATARADQCSDILAHGFYDKTSAQSSGSLTSDVAHFISSNQLQEYAHKEGGGFSLGIPIDGVPLQIGANASDSTYQQIKNAYGSGGSSHISSSDATAIASQLVNKSVVDAWNACMTNVNAAKLLNGALSQNGDDITFIAAYRAAVISDPKPVVSSFYMTNATCDNPLHSGDKIDISGTTVLCHRKNNEAVTTVLNTDRGNLVMALDPKFTTNQLEMADQTCPNADRGCIIAFERSLLQHCGNDRTCRLDATCRTDRLIAHMEYSDLEARISKGDSAAPTLMGNFMASPGGKEAKTPIDAPCEHGGGAF